MTENTNTTMLANKAPVAEANAVNPLDENKAPELNDSGLIKGIVDTGSGGKKDNLLEDAPEIDMSILEDVGPERSILLLVLKLLFGFLVVLAVVGFIFFTSQLSDKLSVVTSKIGIPNASAQLQSSNSEIINLQTNLNFYRYLAAKANLDSVSFYGDTFIQNYELMKSRSATTEEKRKAKAKMDSLRNNIENSLKATKEKFTPSFIVPLFSRDLAGASDLDNLFKSELEQKMRDKSSELAKVNDPQAQAESKNYLQSLALISNQNVKDITLSTDFEAINDDDLYALLKDVNTSVVNDMSLIHSIKEERITWSDIINEIELRTIAVDKYYNDGLYDKIGGIRYNSYDFDAEKKNLSIAGETKTIDTANFTMISNLIEELNKSDLFENGAMRSFSKSGSFDKGYTSSLKLTLDLEKYNTEKE